MIFLAGLPFAPLLERRLDLWHGHGLWSALWIGILFGLTLLKKNISLGNKPLAYWLILSWLWVFWTFMQGIVGNKQYNLKLFMPLLHIVSIVLFYVAAKAMWSRSFIEHLLKVLAISGSILVAYGLSQTLGFDPLFKDLDTSKKTHEIVGMIGNPSHFGVYLAIILPIFWTQRTWLSRITQAGIWGLLATLLIKNSSVSGILSAIAASITYWSFQKRYIAILVGILLVAVLGFLFFNQAHFHQILTDSGRFQAWSKFSKLIGKSPLFGAGPGAIQFIAQSIKEGFMVGWRHCHNEWLQLTIEQGFAGLAIGIWFLYDLARRVLRIAADPLVPALAAVITAFVCSSFLSYPAHLWMIGSIGLFSICAINVLSEIA